MHCFGLFSFQHLVYLEGIIAMQLFWKIFSVFACQFENLGTLKAC